MEPLDETARENRQQARVAGRAMRVAGVLLGALVVWFAAIADLDVRLPFGGRHLRGPFARPPCRPLLCPCGQARLEARSRRFLDAYTATDR